MRGGYGGTMARLWRAYFDKLSMRFFFLTLSLSKGPLRPLRFLRVLCAESFW